MFSLIESFFDDILVNKSNFGHGTKNYVTSVKINSINIKLITAHFAKLKSTFSRT